MAEVVVSVRVGKEMHDRMKLHDEINWSAAIRKSIGRQLSELEQIDAERAKKAAKAIESLRRIKAFDKGKKSVEIIREWRQKRK